MNKVLATTIVACAIAASPADAASLIGSTVNVSTRYPDANTVYSNGGDRVVSNGVEYATGTFSSYNPGFSVDVQVDRIIIMFTGNPNFGTANFNGFVLRSLSGLTLTNAVVDAASTFSPISATTTSGNLFLNFSGVQAPSTGVNSSVVRFDVNAPIAAVPEPATWAMMVFGFGVLGFAMRRKNKVAARIRFA